MANLKSALNSIIEPTGFLYICKQDKCLFCLSLNQKQDIFLFNIYIFVKEGTLSNVYLQITYKYKDICNGDLFKTVYRITFHE